MTRIDMMRAARAGAPLLTGPGVSRRGFLKAATLAGCSAAAWPLMAPVTLAAAPGDNRFVVIVLRGAMDGLDALRPVGDADYAGLRGDMLARAPSGPMLGNFFALHPALAPLEPLWQAGEFAFAHSVATPYRDKRSHFDGQDILEAGTGGDVPDLAVRDGWLNRLLQEMPGVEGETAFAIGRDQMKILEGAVPVMSWAPQTRMDISDQGRALLARIYEEDALFHAASAQAIEISSGLEAAEDALDAEMEAGMDAGAAPGMGAMAGGKGGKAMDEDMDADDMAGNDMAGNDMAGNNSGGTKQGARAPQATGGGAGVALARFAASRLVQETRIASFSLGGWDTHRNQRGLLSRRLRELSATLLALREDLGPVWGKTTVLVMTEFGRTARENGTEGTDHGTGTAMMMAGGAIRGGRAYGDWPGLSEAALYEGRDLMPTRDVRAYAGWAMHGLFGIEKTLIERSIFPGLELGADPGFIL